MYEAQSPNSSEQKKKDFLWLFFTLVSSSVGIWKVISAFSPAEKLISSEKMLSKTERCEAKKMSGKIRFANETNRNWPFSVALIR